MLTSLQPFLARSKELHFIDVLYPKLVSQFQQEFVHIIDGGSGIGDACISYWNQIESHLTHDLLSEVRIYCYEPLPENVKVLRSRFGAQSQYVIRDVALSNRNDQAEFRVPSRMTGKVGSWDVGTSYSGSLRSSSDQTEKIAVQTVRLEDEGIPCIDFVKLDLQGAEILALEGMGRRIMDPKIFYIETQLLYDYGALRLLSDNGYLLYYDRLQFGFRPDLNFMPLCLMDQLGICIDKLHLPNDAGIPLICWGHLDPSSPILDPDTLVIRPEISKQLIDEGFQYLQTDCFAISPEWANRVLPLMMP